MSLTFYAILIVAHIFNREPLQQTHYAELPIGAIQPQGWLLEQLNRQASGLTGHLDEVYPEVMGDSNAWLGGDGDAWDSANNVQDWRRYGDRFFVTGTWQDGKIYLPSFNANKIVALSVANGARTAVEQYAAGTNSPDGIKDLTVYPGGKELFLSNLSIANLVAATGNKANGWDEYTLDKASAKGVGTYGYNFFEFDGKKYMAYARATEKSAQIEVIEDQGTEDNFVASIDAQAGLLSAAIQTEGLASGNTADCCVREIDGVIYIAALSRDGGLALYKLIKK